MSFINSDLKFHEIVAETSKPRQYAQIFFHYMKEKIDLKVTPNITRLLNNAFLLASSSENVEIYDHMSMLCEAIFFMKLLKEELLPLIRENPDQQKYNDLQVTEILDHFLES